MNKEAPYLSIVIAVRNDNYGGDFIQRLQNFIRWNTDLLEKHKVATEIVLVNWNPIENKPTLKESIKWVKNRQYVAYRIITVPKEVHLQFCDQEVRKVLPLYEYLAKNVGIRRANGQFVLAMNPDIQIDERIIRKISSKKLESNRFYRANRIDFKNGNINNKTSLWLKGFKYSKTDFLWLKKVVNKVKCLWRVHSVKFEWFFNIISWKVYYHNAEYKYQCNVSGDFLLMHKKSWLKLKGNPENTFLPLHTDALMVVMAGTSGLKEYIFKYSIYHQEHNRRFDASEKQNQENRTAYVYFQEEAQKMINNKKAIIYNNDSWGLINFELQEETF